MKRSDNETGGRSRQGWQRLNEQAFHLYQQGRYTEAISIAKQASELARQEGGTHHPDYAASLDNLARLYYSVGDFAAAEPLFRQVLEIRRITLGVNHPDYISALDTLAGFYRYIGNYTSAESLLQQVLEIKRSALGEHHPDYATSLNNLAVLYQEMENHGAAEPLLRDASDIWRRTLGEHHPDYATSLDNMAVFYLSIGNYAAAEPLFRQALEIKRKALGEDHPDYATSLNNLAELYRAMGNDAAAEPLYYQASEIWRTALGERHPNYATSLNNLGRLYQSMGNFTAAEPHLHQALEIRRQALGEDHPAVTQSLHNLIALYTEMGNYSAAEPLYHQALEITRKTLGDGHPEYLAGINQLAGLQMEMGNYGASESLYLQALEITRKTVGEDPLSYASNLNGLGVLYQEMANYPAAERFLRQALEIRRTALGDSHPDVAQILSNLAVLYTRMYSNKMVHGFRGYVEALPLYERALEITRSALGEDHPSYADRLDNLAWLHLEVAHYDQAILLFEQALEITRSALGEEHPAFAARLNSLAVLYSEAGNYLAAEPLLRRALEVWRRRLGEDNHSYANSLINLLKVCAATGRQAEAIELMAMAAAVQDRIIGQVFSISSEAYRMAYVKKIQADLNLFLSLASESVAEFPKVKGIALELVLHRKAIGAEALAAQRHAVISGRYPTLETALHKLSFLRTQIAQKTLAGPDQPGTEALRAYKQLLAEWSAERDQLEAELARQIPEMNLEQQFRSIDWQTIAKSLPTGAALVEFARYEVFDFQQIPAQSEMTLTWDHTLQRWDSGEKSRYLAFVLIAGETDNVRMLDLGAAGSIDRKIIAFRAVATGSERAFTIEPEETRLAEDSTHGVALRAAVFDPLLEALGERTRLFLAPDGELSQLPLEALPLDDGRRLIDAYQISYLSTGRDLLRFTNQSDRSSEPPVVLADPDFDLDAEGSAASVPEGQPLSHQSRDLDRSALRFNRLKGARQEGEQVGDQLGVKPLLAETALEGTLKRLRSPRILHLATHGFFLPDQPQDLSQRMPDLPASGTGERLFGQRLENPLLRSGLALAGANSWLTGKMLPPEAEDGLMTAEDVTGLDLLDTELVVLSACDTGRGVVQVGEGVFGLRRAFVLAGARTLVMSLWKVPDQATRELMVDFYQRLLNGAPRAEALRQAQLEMKKKYPDPRFWGAFICQGDPGPLLKVGPESQLHR